MIYLSVVKRVGETSKYAIFIATFCEQLIQENQRSLLDSQGILCEHLSDYWRSFQKSIAMLNQTPSYVEISLLRNSLLKEDIPQFLMEGFNDQWLFDGKIYESTLAFESFSQMWSNCRKLVFVEAKRYMGQIPHYLAEKALLKMADDAERTLAEIFYKNRETWMPSPTAEKTVFPAPLQCSLGAYRLFQYSIYEGTAT